jgi:hypothetical protein
MHPVSGKIIEGRSFPPNVYVELSRAVAEPMVAQGLLRPAPEFPDVSGPQVERARVAVEQASRKAEAARNRFAELGRDLEMNPNAGRELKLKNRDDVYLQELDVASAEAEEAAARRELAGLERGLTLTRARAELADRARKLVAQDEVVAAICTVVVDLQKIVERALSLGPNAFESRRRITDAVERAARDAGFRADEIAWVLGR